LLKISPPSWSLVLCILPPALFSQLLTPCPHIARLNRLHGCPSRKAPNIIAIASPTEFVCLLALNSNFFLSLSIYPPPSPFLRLFRLILLQLPLQPSTKKTPSF
jgi:hypothetical protein